MTFGAPHLLLGLLAVPAAAIGYLLLERRRARRATRWSRQALQPNIVARPPGRLRYLPAASLLLALSFLLVGFARPRQVLGAAGGSGATIVLTFDVSGSMAANDVAPTRLRAARRLAISFLHELPPQYRVAVVTVGNAPHLLVAPTTDRALVLSALPVRVAPLAGTAIGDGIDYAVAVVGGATGSTQLGSVERPGAVLLFSDGGQNAGGTSPQEAIVSALVDYVPVDTVAVGTKDGVITQPVTVLGQKYSTQFGVPVAPALLRSVASQSGGSFFDAATASRSPAQLAKVWKGLHSTAAQPSRTHSLSAPAAAFAVAFILAGIVLPGVWFGRVP